MSNKIKLFSDFKEPYDHMFDSEGMPFTRFSQDILSKREQFVLLEAAKFLVPSNNYLYKLMYTLFVPERYWSRGRFV